MTNKEMSTL